MGELFFIITCRSISQSKTLVNICYLKEKMVTFLLFATVFFLFLLILILFYLFYTSYSTQAGAIYFPTKDSVVKQMLELAKITPKDTVLDLGSGDGRILIEAARRGVIDPLLVLTSRQKIKESKLTSLAQVHLKSFWSVDLNQATVITLYLYPKFMKKLQQKLEKELKHPILLVSNVYQFPGKKPLKESGSLRLYRFP